METNKGYVGSVGSDLRHRNDCLRDICIDRPHSIETDKAVKSKKTN